MAWQANIFFIYWYHFGFLRDIYLTLKNFRERFDWLKNLFYLCITNQGHGIQISSSVVYRVSFWYVL
jgi:hypothetical protein